MARSYDVIRSEIEKLKLEAQEAFHQERSEAIARILSDMEKFDISVSELTGAVPEERRGNAAGITRAAAPARKPISAHAKRTAAVGTNAAALPVAADVSPAVRLLEEAGIDFRRKRPEAAQPSAPTKKVAAKAAGTAKSAPARNVGVRTGAKTKAAIGR
jgi:hypothetical protein